MLGYTLTTQRVSPKIGDASFTALCFAEAFRPGTALPATPLPTAPATTEPTAAEPATAAEPVPPGIGHNGPPDTAPPVENDWEARIPVIVDARAAGAAALLPVARANEKAAKAEAESARDVLMKALTAAGKGSRPVAVMIVRDPGDGSAWRVIAEPVAGSPDRIITADMVGQTIKGRASSFRVTVEGI